MKLIYFLSVFLVGVFVFSNTTLNAQEGPIPKLQVFVYGVPPYTSGYQGKITGPIVDDVKAYLDRTGLDYKLDNLPWTAAYERTKQRPNTLIFPIDRTESREDSFLWIKPLLRQEYFLFTRNVEGFKDLTLEKILAGDYTFACQKNSSNCLMLDDIGIPKERVFEGNSTGVRSIYNLMVRGGMNFSIFDPLVYEAILNRYELETERLTPLFKIGNQVGYLGANKDTDPRILKRLNKFK